MKILPKDYDKIMNILNRNPLASYKEIASVIPNATSHDVSNLFKEIRQEYFNKDAVENFLENNTTNKDPILFTNGILKSICDDNLDQSFQMGNLFEQIATFYENTEKDDTEPKYDIIYKYFAALMLNKPLPELRPTESAMILTILFEVINYSDEMLARLPDQSQGFIMRIHKQLGQYLVKASIPEDEWNEKNNEALIQAFRIPQVDIEKYERDPETVTRKIQKSVVFHSLDPFHVPSEEIRMMKEFLDELLGQEVDCGRDLKVIQDKLDIDLSKTPVVTKLNGGSKVIMHRKCLEKRQQQIGGKHKLTDDHIDIENEIHEKITRYDIIDFDQYRKSLAVGISNEHVSDAPMSTSSLKPTTDGDSVIADR